MKKLTMILAVCLMSFSTLIAQKTKKGADKMNTNSAPMISQEISNMSQGTQNGFSVLLPETDAKTVRNLWKSLMKSYDSKVKNVKKSDDQVAAAAKIASIGGNSTVDVYSQISKSGENVSMTIWFDMGQGIFLSPEEYPNSYSDAEQLLETFAISVQKTMTEKELNQEEKELKKVEGDLKNLARKKESLLKDIEKYKKRIEEAEQAIVENETAQEETNLRLEEQKERVSEVVTKLQNIEE